MKNITDKAKNYRISVIVATYNGALFVTEQLDSIANQSVKPDEIVICDDCSKDNTIEVLKDFSNRTDIPCIIYQNDKNKGVSKTFEEGVLKSSGDVIFFSDQDDVWLDNKIETALHAFDSLGADFVFTNALIVDADLKAGSETLWDSVGFDYNNDDEYVNCDKNEFFNILLKHNVVTGMTMACSRNFAKKCIPFPEKVLHDYWLALNASLFGNTVAIRTPLVKYRQHSNNVVGTRRNYDIHDKSIIKQRHLKNIEYEIMLYQTILSLCRQNKVSDDCLRKVNNYYAFSFKRKETINKSIFSILRLKKGYKKYTYKGNRFFAKDIYYNLFLKRTH